MRLSPKLVLVNQSAGPLFVELAEDLAGNIGLSFLVTGARPEIRCPQLMLRPAPAYDRRNLFTRLWSWMRFLLVAQREILSLKPTVPLLVVSNPPMLPWLALLSHLFCGRNYIVLVYDIYPDILINLGKIRSSSLLIHLWRYFNLLSYHHAAQVVTLGSHMARTLQQAARAQRLSVQVSIVPTWVDTDRFVPLDKASNDFALRHGQGVKLTVLYSGNIGFSHDIGILIDAARILCDVESFHFVIIGGGPGKTALVEQVRRGNLANVTFLPYQPEEMLPYSLASADVAVVSIGRGAEGLMMPSKTYYAMAVGSALIGISHPPNDLTEVIEQYGCGVNVLPGDVEGLVAALQRFLADEDYLRAARRKARDAAVQHFSRAMNTKRFLGLVQSCLGIDRGGLPTSL